MKSQDLNNTSSPKMLEEIHASKESVNRFRSNSGVSRSSKNVRSKKSVTKGNSSKIMSRHVYKNSTKKSNLEIKIDDEIKNNSKGNINAKHASINL